MRLAQSILTVGYTGIYRSGKPLQSAADDVENGLNRLALPRRIVIDNLVKNTTF